MYVTLKGIEEKIRIKLELELELQRSNILKENTEKISTILDPIPNLDWDYQFRSGNEKSKEIVAEIFIKFKEALIHYTKHSSPLGIYHSVKVAVLKLNQAQNLGLIIETDEREILCASIDKLVEATGFCTYGIDITLKWRKW